MAKKPTPLPATFADRLLLTKEETALVLNCGKTTVYELRKAGRLKVVPLGARRLFTAESVRRVATEGWEKPTTTPAFRRGAEHYRSKARRDTDQKLAQYLLPTPSGVTLPVGWLSYLRKLPVEIPAGTVLMHNSVRPTRRLGLRGFRAWLADPDPAHQTACACNWAPELGTHFVPLTANRADD